MVNVSRATKENSAKIGDIVLVQENLQWRLARVDKLIEGRDGLCRAAQVKLANGNRIQRPLQLLFPLEVQDTIPEGEQQRTNQEENSEEIKLTVNHQRPPMRRSAVETRQKIQLWTQ